MPYNNVAAIAFDHQGNVWIGTLKGLAKFDGNQWIVYTAENSPLPTNEISDVFVDRWDNKWIATHSGLAVYREGGVIITDIAEQQSRSCQAAVSVDPRFRALILTVEIEKPASIRLQLYNLRGQKVHQFSAQEHFQGRYHFTIPVSTLPSGVYGYRLQIGTQGFSGVIPLVR